MIQRKRLLAKDVLARACSPDRPLRVCRVWSRDVDRLNRRLVNKGVVALNRLHALVR